MGGAVENQKRVTMGGLNLIPHHNRTVTDAGLGLIVCFLKIISQWNVLIENGKLWWLLQLCLFFIVGTSIWFVNLSKLYKHNGHNESHSFRYLDWRHNFENTLKV